MKVKTLIENLQGKLQHAEDLEVFVVTRSGPRLDPLVITTENGAMERCTSRPTPCRQRAAPNGGRVRNANRLPRGRGAPRGNGEDGGPGDP